MFLHCTLGLGHGLGLCFSQHFGLVTQWSCNVYALHCGLSSWPFKQQSLELHFLKRFVLLCTPLFHSSIFANYCTRLQKKWRLKSGQCFNSDFDDYIHFVWFANSFICSIICLSDFVKAYERCLTNGQHKISAGRSKKRQLPPKHNVFNQANKTTTQYTKFWMKKQKKKSRLTIFNQVTKRQRQETLLSIKQTKRQERFMVRKKKQCEQTNKTTTQIALFAIK